MYVRGDKCSIMKWILSNTDSVADGRTSLDIHLGAPPTPHSPPEGWIKLLQSHEADGYETLEIKHCEKWKELSPNQLFLPNDIHQSPTHSREEKDHRVKQFQIRAGMCSSKSLLIFTCFSPSFLWHHPAGPGRTCMEQERMCWPESELQFKGTAPPSHVHTGFSSTHL